MRSRRCPRLRALKTPTALLLAWCALVITGCDQPDDPMAHCVGYASMLLKCAPQSEDGSSPSAARMRYLVRSCQSQAQRASGLPEMMTCTLHGLGDCSDFLRCLEDRAQKVNAEVLQRAREAGDSRYVLTLCSATPKLAGCREAKMAIIEGYLDQKLVRIRDGGGLGSASTTCFEAKSIAKRIGDLPKSLDAAIQRRCREASAGRSVREVLALVKDHLKRRSDVVPRRCQTVMAQLRRIEGSAWARQSERTLAQACYGELGLAVLKHRLARAKRCDHVLAEIIGGIRTYGLKGARLKSMYSSAKQLCAVNPAGAPSPGIDARRGTGSKAPTVRGPVSSPQR